MRIDLLTVGRMKSGAFKDLFEDYSKRLQWQVRLIEVESKITDPVQQQQDECSKLLQHIKPEARLFCMDERGKSLRSIEFADTFKNMQLDGAAYCQFVIGGAMGLTDEIRGKANCLLSFGRQTWPHMMVRVMLIEQIYRSQQILLGHPYHREG